MKEYVFVVQSNAIDSRDDDYNEWYDNQHIADMLAVPGVVSAKRFVLVDPSASPQKYLTLYSLRTDDPQAVFATIGERIQSGQMPISDAMSATDGVNTLYVALDAG